MKKPITKRWWFRVLMVLLAIIIIGGIFGDKKEETESTEPAIVAETSKTEEKTEDKRAEEQKEATEEEARKAEGQKSEETKELPKEEEKVEPEEEPIYEFDKAVPVGKLAFAVHEIKETDTIESNNQFVKDITTTGKLIMITASIRNDDKESRTVDSSFFKLIDDQGREFDPMSNSNLMIILGDSKFFFKSLNPGMHVSGIVVFEVPSELEHYKLRLSGGFFSFKEVEIRLK